MPAKYTIRNFQEGGIYHIYNKGVAKQTVFLNNEDFSIFLYYLSSYLLPSEKVLQRYPDTPLRIYSKNLADELELLSYCLMPNHFNLILKSKFKDSIPKLMKQLSNAYTFYFNSKYQSRGQVFEGVYKCIEINSEQLIHLVRFIHLNPLNAFLVDNPKNYQWSSHSEYLQRLPNLCNIEFVLSSFPSLKQWEQFILDQKDYTKTVDKIKDLIFD